MNAAPPPVVPDFAGLLAPLDAAEFLRDIHCKRTAHVPGATDKFTAAISWDRLNQLLEETNIWTASTLRLVKDGMEIPARQYASNGDGRDGPNSQLIDVARTNALIEDGAAVLLCDVATLAPGLKQIAESLSAAVGGKVHANLCYSQHAQTIAATRFDIADLYVLQIAGSGVWRLYERAVSNPVAHTRFQDIPPAVHEANRGTLQDETTLRAGDLLYIPAGVTHEVRASSGGALHAAFAVEVLPVLAVISVLYDIASGDELFRAALPDPADRDGKAFEEHLMRLAGRIKSMLADAAVRSQLETLVREFRTPADRIDLPKDARGG